MLLHIPGSHSVLSLLVFLAHPVNMPMFYLQRIVELTGTDLMVTSLPLVQQALGSQCFPETSSKDVFKATLNIKVMCLYWTGCNANLFSRRTLYTLGSRNPDSIFSLHYRQEESHKPACCLSQTHPPEWKACIILSKCHLWCEIRRWSEEKLMNCFTIDQWGGRRKSAD